MGQCESYAGFHEMMMGSLWIPADCPQTHKQDRRRRGCARNFQHSGWMRLSCGASLYRLFFRLVEHTLPVRTRQPQLHLRDGVPTYASPHTVHLQPLHRGAKDPRCIPQQRLKINDGRCGGSCDGIRQGAFADSDDSECAGVLMLLWQALAKREVQWACLPTRAWCTCGLLF